MFLECQTNLYVAEMDRALGFWRDLLGLAETYRFPRDGTPSHVELRIGGSKIALSSAEGLRHHNLPPAVPGAPFEIAIRTEDPDAALAHLRAAGVAVLREAISSPAGNRVAYVTDPDGNRIQLYAHAK